MSEIAKPPLLLKWGGAWFRSGAVEIHLGVERECRPAGTAHPAIQVEDADAAATRLVSFGAGVEWEGAIPNVRCPTFMIPQAIARNSCSRSHRQATATRPDWHAIRVAWPPAGHCGGAGPQADLPDEADGRPGPWADADPLRQYGFAQSPLTGPRPGLNTQRQAD